VPISCLKIITNALAKKKKFVSPFSFTVKIIRIRCVQKKSKNSNHLKKRISFLNFFLVKITQKLSQIILIGRLMGQREPQQMEGVDCFKS
jgi:hypothetical protein